MNPYLIIGLLVAWVASLWFADDFGYDRAETAVTASWQKRENTELSQANTKLRELSAKYRDAEYDNGVALASQAAKYQKELKNADAQRNLDIAAVRARSIVLRDPGTTGTQSACRGDVPEASPGTGRRDGQAGGQLSDEAAGFLLELVNDADRVVLQLDACQALINTDRAAK